MHIFLPVSAYRRTAAVSRFNGIACTNTTDRMGDLGIAKIVVPPDIRCQKSVPREFCVRPQSQPK
jgi:hypothetical protein